MAEWFGTKRRLYRVAQRTGFNQYGAGFSLFRVDELTSDRYRETEVQKIDPGFFAGLRGAHHLHYADGLTVIDFLRDRRPH